MTRTQLLLTLLAEECNEVAQRASKAIRFGLDEVQEGQELNNAERVIYEFNDLLAVMYKLQDEGILKNIYRPEAVVLKHSKIEKWVRYSQDMGQVETSNHDTPIMCGECWLNSGPDNSPKCKCLTK